jgi:hypothetical protein
LFISIDKRDEGKKAGPSFLIVPIVQDAQMLDLTGPDETHGV